MGRGRGSWRTGVMSDRIVRFGALLTALALAAGIGCSSKPSTQEEKPVIQDPAAQEPGTPPPPPDTQKAVQVQASTPEMEKIAQELARGRSAQEQQAIYESQRHYEQALMFNNRGDFDKAKIEAQKAVEAWHENI